ncbi:hypothetical protein FBY10_101113 [Pseudomonas sp. SJZ103]|uniref:hypothetical protein n=1 Tax=unclassified Pseudomonas TaxID=196821 RepID=UPI0011A663BA|nr:MULTISPECIES: hypothetical protein [unclassified Pseudomonas]TWC74423.1 hypothetical protein FBY10_101113 [Pseudomonas sp. SJZ103]TWC93448.1 hypothetical protein FBY08_101945 [Pseudomonas sp. SJZ094]
MGQNFQGGVGQAAEGDINNFGISISLADANKAESRGLVTAQRKELHELRAKCEELGDDPRDVWRTVHAQLGVTTISEITAEQFFDARNVIRTRLEFLQEEADKRRLVGKVLRVVAEKDAKAEMNNFCELSFGRTQLNNLQKSQLQQTLEFVQHFQPMRQAEVAPIVPKEISIREFLVLHKQSAAALFCFGVLVGGIWF